MKKRGKGNRHLSPFRTVSREFINCSHE